MYWEYYGFKEPPFALTPNPAFLYLSSPHQEAFAHLLFAFENRVGFIELSGEVGTGKTTIIRTLLNQLDAETYRTALIFNPTVTPLGLLKEVNAEFRLDAASNDTRELHQTLNHFLLEENGAGRTVVLVIDEAQNLSIETLEQIRLISNLETERAKLIQIVLVGQPELKDLLARRELRQLDQRITVRYHLKPMHYQDTVDYIRHRIKFAAEGREPLGFSQGAVKRVYRFSGGLPRLINSACDRCVLLAYTREAREVTSSMAALAIADLRKEARRPLARRRFAVAAGAALVVAAAVGVVATSGRNGTPVKHQEARATGGSKGGVAPPDAAPPKGAQDFSRDAALKELAAASERDNLVVALNALLQAWHVPELSSASVEETNLKTLARQRGMMATRVDGGLDALARLDAPAVLHVALPGRGSRLVAVTSIDRDGVGIVPALSGRSRLTRGELAQIWSGGATVLWKDFQGITSRNKPGERAQRQRLLLGLLKGAGSYDPSAGGTLDERASKGVAEFQRKEGLEADGKLNGETLLLLYRRAGGFFPPGIVHDKNAAAAGNGETARGARAEHAG